MAYAILIDGVYGEKGKSSEEKDISVVKTE